MIIWIKVIAGGWWENLSSKVILVPLFVKFKGQILYGSDDVYLQQQCYRWYNTDRDTMILKFYHMYRLKNQRVKQD